MAMLFSSNFPIYCLTSKILFYKCPVQGIRVLTWPDVKHHWWSSNNHISSSITVWCCCHRVIIFIACLMPVFAASQKNTTSVWIQVIIHQSAYCSVYETTTASHIMPLLRNVLWQTIFQLCCAGPALGMFDVFCRTWPPILWGLPFWTLKKFPYKLHWLIVFHTLQYHRLRSAFCFY